MEVKLFELRDSATFVPVLCVKLTPGIESERYLLGRSGYGSAPSDQSKFVLMTGLAGGSDRMTCDPYDWGDNRTRQIAHNHIIENWDSLQSGQVIDVEFLLGERTEPKQSEAFETLY